MDPAFLSFHLGIRYSNLVISSRNREIPQDLHSRVSRLTCQPTQIETYTLTENLPHDYLEKYSDFMNCRDEVVYIKFLHICCALYDGVEFRIVYVTK